MTMQGANCSYEQVVAMGYVPWQKWKNIYEPQKALKCGTLFEALNKPFKGGSRS